MGKIVTMGELLVEIMRPQPGTELFEAGTFRGPFPSGAPGIFVSTVARLGLDAAVIGGVGNDDFGKVLIDRFQKDGVDIRHLLVSRSGPTGTAHVTYFANGSRKFIFHVDHTPAVEACAPESAEAFGDVSFFHIMGSSLMASVRFGKEIVKAMRMFSQAGAKISFDPNTRLEMLKDEESMALISEVYRQCSVFLPGLEELKMIAGEEDAEKAVAKAFAENERLEYLVLKNGSRGSYVYDRSGFLFHQEIFKVPSVDPTGAGDCFDGAFVASLAEGRSVQEAAERGAAAAALNVAAFGPMEGDISKESIARLIAGGKSAG